MSDTVTPPDDRGTSPVALRFRQAFLLLLVVGISILFLLVIRRFLLSVFLAAVFAGLAYPAFEWLKLRTGRPGLAAITTILILVVGVGLPLAGFLTVVAGEAVQVSQGAGDWLEAQSGRLEEARRWADRIPFMGEIIPEGEALVEQFRELAGSTGPFLMGALTWATRGTAAFVLQTFVLLYALFFFLRDGSDILRKILGYIPLLSTDKDQLLERFVSVTRATLKGSLLIGVIQGTVAGVAFWLAGIPGSAFWGTIMVVLSIIPAIGSAFVWVPAVIYLFMMGQVLAAWLLLAWCAVVVSAIDNFLRPPLIGRDARMSDLLILLSTLGGIFLFGAVGFIVGPIIAALFVTVWHIYGETFQSWLPQAADVHESAASDSLDGGPEAESSQEV